MKKRRNSPKLRRLQKRVTPYEQDNRAAAVVSLWQGRENKARNTSLEGHELQQLRQQHEETAKLPKTEPPAAQVKGAAAAVSSMAR
jgi:hypothetical protein